MTARALAVVLLLMAGPALAQMPDRAKTPGAVRDLTVERICSTKWAAVDERAVTAAMRRRVYLAYGYARLGKDPRCPCEVDHLIPRSLGGADVIANLWPESFSGPWNAHMKDRLENCLHRQVCGGKLSLQEAQAGIARDWTAMYRKYYDGGKTCERSGK